MKKLCKILSILLCIVMFGGCGAAKLSSNYSESKLKTAAEKVVDDINSGNYQDIIDKFNNQLKAGVTASQLKEAWVALGSLGKYNSISKIMFQEVKGDAVVVAVVKYDNKQVQITLSYNKNMEIDGIHFK